MSALVGASGLTYVHAEDNDLVEAAQDEAVRSGHIDAAGMAGTRPSAAEERAVAEVLGAASERRAGLLRAPVDAGRGRPGRAGAATRCPGFLRVVPALPRSRLRRMQEITRSGSSAAPRSGIARRLMRSGAPCGRFPGHSRQ